MSNIVKSEYVIFDEGNKHKYESSKYKINTHRDDLFKIYNQREIIISEAEEEARKIIETAKNDARAQIAECKKKAYEDGYNSGLEIGKKRGYKEGYDEGQAKISEILLEQNKKATREIAEMIEKIEFEKSKIISKYEEELANLSIEIAEKVIRNEIETKDNLVSAIIKDVIKDYRNVEWIKIYISSKDDAAAIQADKELADELKKIAQDIKIEVLDELEKGSAIVESADGIVEASIDTQLKNLKEMVLNKNAG
ncbi:MAG: hypothetical protein GX289_01835 [Tissierellia bacterium]|nr:hypothetical protein [Tissierellia bacterium]